MPLGEEYPEIPQGYLNDDEFALSMDSTFGVGNWSQTGGWRSQARENALRAQGAQTVAPGHVSAHSVGDPEAPGARDIVVNGLTPEQAAQKMRENGTYGANQLYPEGATGTQGAHLHVGMSPGSSGSTLGSEYPEAPLGAEYPEVGAEEPQTAKRGLLEQAERAGASAVGGMVKGAGDLLHSLGITNDAIAQNYARQIADTGMMVVGESVVQATPEQIAEAKAAVASHKKYFSPDTEPTAKAIQEKGEAIAPKNRNLLESVLHGGGEMVPALGAAAANPALGAGVFAVQGYAEAYDDAIAHGASPEAADKAARENAAIQGGLGVVPVGHAAEALTHGIGNAAARVGTRYAAGSAGNAALMGTMRAGGNVVAKQNYDPDRDWAEQVPQAMAQGAVGDLLIHGAHDAAATSVRAAQGLLRPREAPPKPAGVEAEPMPATDAIRAYAGQGPTAADAPPAAPHDAFEQQLIKRGSANVDGQTWSVRRHSNPNDVNGQYEVVVSSPGNAVQSVGNSRPLNSLDDAARFAAQAAFPDAGIPDHGSTWTPEREARWQEWAAKHPGAEPVHGDPVLFQTPEGVAHGTVVGEQPDHQVVIDTPAGRAVVPPDQAVPLPKDFEGERIAHGAPLEQMPQAIADVQELRQAAPKGYSLFQAMKDLGGIRNREADGSPIGDVGDVLDKIRRPGLVNNKTGLSPDAMRAALQERGWFGSFDQTQGAEDFGQAKPGDDVNALYELMRREASGKKVLHPSAAGAGERRTDLEDQMRQAGVALSDAPETGAAKLAAWRGEQVVARSPQTEALRERAEELGLKPREDAAYDEILADVLEREAISHEADGWTWDHGEERTDSVLTSDEHEWLTAAGRRPEGERDPPFPAPAALGETGDRPGAQEGAEEPRAGAGGDRERPEGLSGQDQLASERVDLANGAHDHLLIPGSERSAVQAAAAREGPLKAKAPQQDAGGLFAPPEPDQDSLKFAKPPVFYSALERHIDNSTLKAARPDNLRPAAPTPPERLAEIAKRYGEGQSYRRIAREMGVSPSTINRAIDLHGVERRPQIGEDGYQHPASIDEALREEALRLYSDHRMSADDVARRLGISQPVVSRIVKEAGATRSPSERMAMRSEGQTHAERGVAAPWQSFKDGSWLYAHSTYELARMRQLDHDPDVVSYTKRVDRVPMSDGTTYVPDLEIHYRDGRTEVEEIKPDWQLNDPAVLAKARAAKEFFGQLGKEYRLVSEHEIGRQGFADLLDEPFSTLSPGQRQRIRKAAQATMARLDKSQKLLRGQTPSDFRQPKGVVVGRAVPGDREAQSFADKVEAVVRKIAPFAEVVPARHITEVSTGDKAMGVSWRDGLRHIIGWSVESRDAVGIARHEAVHALREAGTIRPEEWETLEEAATNEGWRDRYNIGRRYGELSHDKQIEEAVAERFREWRRDGQQGLSGMVRTVFQRLAKLFDQVRDLAKRTFGAKATAADIFSRMESGEMGARMGREYHPPTSPDLNSMPAFAKKQPEEGREVHDQINEILGRGVETAGRKLQSAAAKALPDPVAEALEETGHAVNLAVNPMAAGSPRAQAAAKDFANALRAADFQHERLDKWLDRRFTDEQQRRMWEAADEEGVILRRGEQSGPGQGLNRLDPEERAAVLNLQERADKAFEEAQALGMVKGDGLESYVPRMIVQMTAFGPKVLERAGPRAQRRGGNLSTTTGQLRQRKYETTEETEAAADKAFGGKATVVRNIRTLPLATQRLERAIAGRTLVQRIKELSSQTGEPLVVEGQKPNDNYFTMDHAALQVWRPRFVTDPETGKTTAAVDQTGDVVFDAHPLWISKEFEGPLKAVLSTPTGPIVRAIAELKAKMMGVIMYSPLMHNAVIWGRALAADPVGVASLEAYRRGSRAKADPETMAQAIRAGLVPISRHFDKIDTASIANSGATFVPGRSWTSQVLGFIPNLFSKDAGDAVKEKVDQFGDLWHNTFLWDRVGDLQMGLYVKMRDDMMRKANKFGINADTAQKIAAHYANRYAGSLPTEGMSKVARQLANWVLFSRSFTLGNMAAFKDVVKGLPSDVRGQIERDAGAQQLLNAQGVARRKAIAMLALDAAFAWGGLWLAAGATAWLTHQRFQAPDQNEEKYKNRFLLRYQADGTAIYGRLPTGKTVEDQWHWLTQPVTTLHQKLSPYGRLVSAIWSNDKGFGRKLYDPYDHTAHGVAKNIGRIVWDTMQSIAPTGQLQGLKDAVVGGPGIDQKTAALQAFLPVAGITVSKGAPGGPAMGDYFAAKDQHDFQVQEAMPGIQKQIKAGDIVGARKTMTELGLAPGLQNYYVRVARNPGLRMSGRKLRDFERFADDRQKAQFARDRAANAGRGQ